VGDILKLKPRKKREKMSRFLDRYSQQVTNAINELMPVMNKNYSNREKSAYTLGILAGISVYDRMAAIKSLKKNLTVDFYIDDLTEVKPKR